MAWKLKIYFSDGGTEEIYEDFETREDAEAEYQSWLDNWDAGREALRMLDDEDIVDCDIWEE